MTKTNDGFHYAYRAQAVVDEEAQVILAVLSAVKFSCRRAYSVICRSSRWIGQSLGPPPFGLTWSLSR